MDLRYHNFGRFLDQLKKSNCDKILENDCFNKIISFHLDELDFREKEFFNINKLVDIYKSFILFCNSNKNIINQSLGTPVYSMMYVPLIGETVHNVLYDMHFNINFFEPPSLYIKNGEFEFVGRDLIIKKLVIDSFNAYYRKFNVIEDEDEHCIIIQCCLVPSQF